MTDNVIPLSAIKTFAIKFSFDSDEPEYTIFKAYYKHSRNYGIRLYRFELKIKLSDM